MQVPSEITYHQVSNTLELAYEDGFRCCLSAEYLPISSPSAEVQGHTPEQAQLPVGKKNVRIVDIEPVGRYAIKIVFSDGHDSGYYDWDYLRVLGLEQAERWQRYLDQLKVKGASRDPDDPRNDIFKPIAKKGCRH